MPDPPLGIIVAILFALFAIGAFPALLWWRRYLRNLFERPFEPQADGTYIVRWIPARGQPATLYRVDGALKAQMVAALVKGSVIYTALYVVLIIGMIVINVVWQMPLAMLGAVVPIGVLKVVLQRRLHRGAKELLSAAQPVDRAEHEASPRPEAPANLRPMIVVSLLSAVIGAVVVAIFFTDPDADKASDTEWLALTLLLVGLPLAVALLGLGLWAARRRR